MFSSFDSSILSRCWIKIISKKLNKSGKKELSYDLRSWYNNIKLKMGDFYMKFTVQDYDPENLDPDRTTKMYVNEAEYTMLKDTFPHLEHIEMRDILYVIRLYDVALRFLAKSLHECDPTLMGQKMGSIYKDALYEGRLAVKGTDTLSEDEAVMEIQIIR